MNWLLTVHKKEVMNFPVVKFTGNFKDGGLDGKQQFYLMTALSNIYFIDTTGTSYAKSITRIDNIPDISNIVIQDRFSSSEKPLAFLILFQFLL